MILVLDTETTGLPKNYKAPLTDFDNWPRAVQIAWVLYENNGAEIERRNFIIRPEGYQIPADATAIHGITTEKALEVGKPIKDALYALSGYLQISDLVVAHNFDYDEAILGSEFLRAGFDYPFDLVKEKVCTMRASTDFCALPGPYGYKWPRLSELHRMLFGTEISGEHDAENDAAACGRCFFELVKRGVIKPEQAPSKVTAAPPMPGYTADEKLAMLASERAAQAEAKAALADLLEGLKKSDAWAYYENAARLHAGNIERLEAEIKADFLAAFDGKNKKPHQYVTLKSFDSTRVTYDPERAFRFCLTNLTTALSLDKKEFEAQAKSGKLPTDLVTVVPGSELRAQIATDLSAYLIAEKVSASSLDKVDGGEIESL